MAQEEGNENTKEKKNLGPLLVGLFAILNFVFVGAGAYLTYISTIGYVSPSKTNEELDRELVEFQKSLQKKPILYTFDQLNTNLEGVPRRFVRVQVSLEMLDEEGYEEVIELGAGAKDSIVRILNSKKYTDLESVQGKLHLKNQIAEQINGFLQRGVVKGVYFSEFVVQ